MKYYVAPNAIEAPIEMSPNSGNTDPAHDITMTASNARSRVCHSNTPPQTDTSPSSAAKCLTLGDGRAFVSVSAIISLVGQ